MPFYHHLGNIPSKRHIQFRKPDGNLYQEELVSTEGFSSMYSLIYHTQPPTMVKEIGKEYPYGPKAAIQKNLQNRSFLTFKTKPEDDYLKSRTYLLFNNDVYLASAAPLSFSSSATSDGRILSSRSSDLFFSLESSALDTFCIL